MRTLIVGHRGTGKTSFLRRAESYYRSAGCSGLFLDLDAEIERRTGRTISAIFASDGEAAFRVEELETFRAIDAETSAESRDVFLVAGGGFDPAEAPASSAGFRTGPWRVLWLRRSSDSAGRIFLDRPRLTQGVSALGEYEERYLAREPRFRARADETLWLDEGLEGTDEAEAGFVLDRFRGLGGALTLLPAMFARPALLAAKLISRVKWGVRWFELRDDLLSSEQINAAIAHIPADRVLVSFRSPARIEETRELVSGHGFAFDWPLEMGECLWGKPRVLSFHERRDGQTLREALARFSREPVEGVIQKAALPVRNFRELWEGHVWQALHPQSRVFLPLSPDGRWSWYRLLQSPNYALNFFREDEGSGADQPTLLKWARHQACKNAKTFAAVLGDPVAHSRTPLEQGPAFRKIGASVFAIRITEDEWRDGGLEVLRGLGLRWAAVTAPLKGLAYEAVKSGGDKLNPSGSLADELRSVNTLAWNEHEQVWVGTNTDLEGFQAAVTHAAQSVFGNDDGSVLGESAVWGGGGTLPVVCKVLPGAQAFSVRSGENRDAQGTAAEDFHPTTVIWAIGRSREAAHEPPAHWKPKLVLDLNYAEDSPGRDYALKCGARYVSGLAMFRAQAEGQRRFWHLPG